MRTLSVFALLALPLLVSADAGSDARAAVAVAMSCQADAKPHLPPPGNCKCGCVQTGACTCKDCDHPKGPAPTPPCPNCQCGCTVTGKCNCKDCDHPQVKKPVIPCSTECVCGCNAGEACACGRTSLADPRSVPAFPQYAPVATYSVQPQRRGSAFLLRGPRGGGQCGPGGCP